MLMIVKVNNIFSRYLFFYLSYCKLFIKKLSGTISMASYILINEQFQFYIQEQSMWQINFNLHIKDQRRKSQLPPPRLFSRATTFTVFNHILLIQIDLLGNQEIYYIFAELVQSKQRKGKRQPIITIILLCILYMLLYITIIYTIYNIYIIVIYLIQIQILRLTGKVQQLQYHVLAVRQTEQATKILRHNNSENWKSHD